MPGKSSVLHETNVTSNVLLAYGGEGELAMDGEGCHIGASFACYRGDNPHNCVKKFLSDCPKFQRVHQLFSQFQALTNVCSSIYRSEHSLKIR